MTNKLTMVVALASIVVLIIVISAFTIASKRKTGPIVGLLPVLIDMGMGDPGKILEIGVPLANV